ncbi:MAG: sensor histidine kinase [Methylocystaceae bacterium]
MDTRLRNTRPFYAWLCFFLAANIIAALLTTGLSALQHAHGNTAILEAPFTGYQNSYLFKERTYNYFNNLLNLMGSNPANTPNQVQTSNQQDKMVQFQQNIITTQRWLNDEGSNLIYFAADKNTGLIVKNNENIAITSAPLPILPSGYDYYWYFDGQQVRVIKDGEEVDVNRLDSGYRDLMTKMDSLISTSKNMSGVRAVLAVNDTIGPNPYARSIYYWERQFLSIIGVASVALAGIAIILLLLAAFRRQGKREFERKLARWSGQMLLEVKLLITFFALLFGIAFPLNFSGYGSYEALVFIDLSVLTLFWWLYLMTVDLICNRQRFFSHNIINSTLLSYRQYESQYPFQQAMLKRVLLLVASEAVMALLSVFFLMLTVNDNGGLVSFLIALALAGAGIYLIYRYLLNYRHMVTDLGSLIDHIAQIKSGTFGSRLELDPRADLYSAAEDLNSIQQGLNTAVEDRIKAERMKVELITNVSHDLKTPLTSIISYVDLLAKEDALSATVRDYVTILSQKSERLQNLVQDLFDLSKASTDNINLELEKLDLTRLIQQTLGDMEEQIVASGLTFRTSLPETPVYIFSDGKKLYRVWQNLISNTLKYSLTGSRVYIDLVTDSQEVLATIKNTANYEMNFSEDEIVARFVRGDESRNSEGSGLGLSIAQSFTQICGGKFKLQIDGDLFKVELRFPLV